MSNIVNMNMFQISKIYVKVHNHSAFLQEEESHTKQECIPVGCVPSAAVAVCWGGGGLPQCMLGYTPLLGLDTPWAWTPPRPGPGHPSLGRPPSYPPPGLGLDTPPGQIPHPIPPRPGPGHSPPVNRMTDRCKNSPIKG